jgi:hypothetical protein
MARQTNIYKIDRRDVQEKLALTSVLDQAHEMEVILHFCDMFSIPLDQDVVNQRVADLTLLRDAILAQSQKVKPKK